MASALLLSGCTNNDYDFNEVDMTMGFGSETLTIPYSSTKDIPLEDILDLEADGCVKADATTNYDYKLDIAAGNTEPSKPFVEPVVNKGKTTTKDYEFDLSDALSNAKARRAGAIKSMTVNSKPIVLFDYEGNAKEVIKLTSAETDEVKMSLKIANFPEAMKKCVSTIKTMDVYLPEYLVVDNIQTSNGIKITQAEGSPNFTLSNVPTNKTLTIAITAKKLDFTKIKDKKFGNLTITDGHIAIDGSLEMEINFDVDVDALATHIATGGSTHCNIQAQLDVQDITIRKASGYFNPVIDLNDMGETDVTGVPDFLQDERVCVDLDNPRIIITMHNNMDLDATIIGSDIVATKGGKETARVALPQIAVNRNGETVICVCHKATGEYANEYVVSNLPDLVKTIPDNVKINQVSVVADATKESSFKFMKENDPNGYRVWADYAFDAPLAFGPKANIVYKDTLNDWNDDIKDLKLADGAYVQLDADVLNSLPIHLTVGVTPVDINGKDLSKEIKVEIPNAILASADGKEKKASNVIVKLIPQNEDALGKLDGLIYEVSGSSYKDGQSTVEGITLNSQNQKIRLENIKIQVVGKVIGDFN